MSRKEVLVVDDEEAVHYTVRTILEKAGHEVTCAESGEECLEKLRTGFRGLILMDVMMPQMDGWETVRCMVEDGLIEGNVICMLTGLPEPEPQMDPLKEYVLDFITKPFRGPELTARVEELLQMVP